MPSNRSESASGPETLKQLGRGVSNDMSSEAIARRLEIVSQLFELTRALAGSRRIDGDATSQRQGKSSPP